MSSPDEPRGTPAWVAALAVAGGAATVTVLSKLFVAWGRRPTTFEISDTPEAGSDEFLLGISGTVNAPLQSGGTARLLNNGVEIFPAMLEAINGARRTINFMCYIWEPGTVSDRMFDALIARQREGVQVRMMLDAFGAVLVPRDRVEELVEAGGSFQWFHAVEFGKLTSFYKRNHRRAIVIDGRIAFTGGAAVADKWLGDAEDEEHWRDMMVEVRGCLANNLQSAFTQLWADTSGEILLGDDFYPRDFGADDGGGEEVTRHVNVISSPAESSHPLRLFYSISFACARERIWLTSPYFVPDPATRRILRERARAGVDVRLLLPGRLTDAAVVRWAGHAYYRELLESGVRIFEYQRTMIHSKALVIDGKWSVVGSANMDIRSKELNQESVIGIMDRGFGKQLEDTFEDDLKEAKEITRDFWRTRGPFPKVRALFWEAFAEQL
ncbi:MAG TPA: phospholipase D-like domain-containing protein [Longimicrobium sp.]